MGYEIKVLSSEEFDKLPYDGIGDSLGFADVKKGKVYVRNTGMHELNRYLINHEIDHMVEEHATDEDEHGIRHKKFFKEIFLPLFTGYNAQTKSWSPLGIIGHPSTDQKNAARDAKMQQTEGGNEAPQFTAPDGGGMSGPFGQFSAGATGTSSVPSNVGGNIGGGLNQGSLAGQSGQISPDMIEKIKGYYSGRIAF